MTERLEPFVESARGRLQALRARRDAGQLDAAGYDSARRAIEREVGDALLAAGPTVRRARPSTGLVAGIVAVVAAVGVAGYAWTGSPSLATGSGAASRVAAAGPAGAASDPIGTAAERQIGTEQIAAMVGKLAERLKERPDDAEGWVMLARSYTVLGRFADAVPAYRRAIELRPKDASLLADFADVTSALQGKADNPESAALLERALALDPKQPKALALSGTVAFDRGDYAAAAARWQQIVDVLPPGNEMRKQAEASVAEARAKAGAAGAGATGPLASRADAPPAAAPDPTAAKATSATSPTGPAAAGAVTGTVTLDPSLAARAGPDDTVFVFARAATGGRMPLAVRRARVADLPLRFTLDDSMAMTPSGRLSTASSVIVGARISKSGNAMPQPGDLAGEAPPVAPGASGIAIRIGSVVAGG